MDEMDFGAFIAAKRREAGLTQRETARHLGITAAYLCDVEKGNRCAFDLMKLHRFALAAGLSEADRARLYDLAGESRGEISPDISQYINDHNYVCAALRQVKTLNASEEDWNTMLSELKRRKGV